MSSITVNAENERVITDILVVGYTLQETEKYAISIPNEIIGIIFLFWFIDVCDEWDKSLCSEYANINGQCVKFKNDKICSIFGIKSVEKGIFEWKLEFKTEIKWCCIGIIQDELDILRKSQDSCDHFWKPIPKNTTTPKNKNT